MYGEQYCPDYKEIEMIIDEIHKECIHLNVSFDVSLFQ